MRKEDPMANADVILETITIKYDTAYDRFTYDPPYVPKINTGPTRANGDNPQICFECTVDGVTPEGGHDFAIHFVGPCPLKKVRGRSDNAGQIVKDIVVGGPEAPPGRYHYFVAVSVLSGENDAVTGDPFVPGIYTDDPDIMVW